MALMCDECKCSTYYNEETGLYSCENGCPCCNDPEWVSDSELLAKKLKEALAWAERNEHAFDLAEYASNDPENTANRHYWQGQIDILKQLLEQENN